VLPAANVVSQVLTFAMQLKILVTSRERLRLVGEHEYAVPPLSENDAMALFDDRARAVMPTFRVKDEPETVLAICRRLDLLPLALELAAARIKLLAAKDLLARLDRRLSFLVSGARDLPRRQQTLRATVDWSYELLDPSEQRVFVALGVFVGGFAAEAAEAICDGTLELLSSLLDKSLLRHDQGLAGEPRFGMLETIREYAVGRLEARGEKEEVRSRHAHYYAELAHAQAEGRDQGVELPPVQRLSRAEWGQWVAREGDNLTSALGWAIEREDAELALGLVLGMWRWLVTEKPLREGQRWTDRVIQLKGVADLADFGWLLAVSGNFSRLSGDYPRARALLERAIAAQRPRGEERRLATALEALGLVLQEQGDYERALTLHEESLGLARKIGDPLNIWLAINGLAVLAWKQGDYDRMATLAEEELSLHRQISDGSGIAEALHNLAEARRHQGRIVEAASLYHEAMSRCVELGDVSTLAECLDGFADIAAALGDPKSVTPLWAVSQRLLDEVGQVPWDSAGAETGVAAARATLGSVAFEGDWQAGKAMSIEQAVAKATAISNLAARTGPT
jgi:predicted ATPase